MLYSLEEFVKACYSTAAVLVTTQISACVQISFSSVSWDLLVVIPDHANI
jgi:hypothetical protein